MQSPIQSMDTLLLIQLVQAESTGRRNSDCPYRVELERRCKPLLPLLNLGMSDPPILWHGALEDASQPACGVPDAIEDEVGGWSEWSASGGSSSSPW